MMVAAMGAVREQLREKRVVGLGLLAENPAT
jgi:hypothetical protein